MEQCHSRLSAGLNRLESYSAHRLCGSEKSFHPSPGPEELVVLLPHTRLTSLTCSGPDRPLKATTLVSTLKGSLWLESQAIVCNRAKVRNTACQLLAYTQSEPIGTGVNQTEVWVQRNAAYSSKQRAAR